MKQHLLVWLAALIAVALASVVYISRQTTARTSDALASPAAAVDQALALLEVDPNALRVATQRAIRAASVLAEGGSVPGAKGAFLLGYQYMREHNFHAAEGQFKKAIALDPAWSWPYANLGNLLGLHSFGRTAEAMDVLQKSAALDPEWGRPYGIMAVILRAEGKFDEALVQAELALKYMPENISPLNNYANLLVDLKRFDEAEVYYRRAIESFPEHPKPYYNLACLYALVGRKAESLDNLQEAFRRSDALRYEAVDDADLANLRGDPLFESLVHRDRAGDRPAGHDAGLELE